ncbi:MAG: hypothetical protein PHZ19_06195 [Candidatus Thermoplasmatota archaeon]|nr:hypothetical protein [Candidatus Thermoplasmatota archaeon]
MKRPVFITLESYAIRETEGGDGFIIEGLALPFGKRSRNGLTYDRNSIKETAEKWKGLPIFYNHNVNALPLGHVVKAEVKHGKKGFEDGLYYQGNIDNAEEAVVRKLKRGDIPFVSIQAIVEPTESGNEDDVYIREPLELSICGTPGFPETTVNGVEVVAIESVFAPAAGTAGTETSTAKEPFAGYKDFDECVSKNQDKDDPEAYCAAIKRKVEELGVLHNNGERDIVTSMDEKEMEKLMGLFRATLREEIADAMATREQDEPAPEPASNLEGRVAALEEKVASIQEQITALIEKAGGEEPSEQEPPEATEAFDEFDMPRGKADARTVREVLMGKEVK